MSKKKELKIIQTIIKRLDEHIEKAKQELKEDKLTYSRYHSKEAIASFLSVLKQEQERFPFLKKIVESRKQRIKVLIVEMETKGFDVGEIKFALARVFGN